jgi:hypothetical protein
LAQLVAVWTSLPEEVRRAILVMVEAVRPRPPSSP